MRSTVHAPIFGKSIMGACLLTLALVLPSEAAWAGDRRHDAGRPHSGRGGAVRVLPRHYSTVRIGPRDVYHHRGVFYRRAPSGFAVIPAPIGAVVASLPSGFSIMAAAGGTYFYFGETYYQPCRQGYRVVKSPAGLRSRPAPPARFQEQVRVTARILNIRSGPGSRHGVIGQAYNGTILTILDHDRGWLYVRLPNGRIGWVQDRYTSEHRCGAKG